jgi:truncated hemoglobin YjbI
MNCPDFRPTPYYALGVLRVTTGAETGAEFKMRLADDGFSERDCELWARLFETFANGVHTAASEALLRERAEDYEDATFRLFEHREGRWE